MPSFGLWFWNRRWMSKLHHIIMVGVHKVLFNSMTDTYTQTTYMFFDLIAFFSNLPCFFVISFLALFCVAWCLLHSLSCIFFSLLCFFSCFLISFSISPSSLFFSLMYFCGVDKLVRIGQQIVQCIQKLYLHCKSVPFSGCHFALHCQFWTISPEYASIYLHVKIIPSHIISILAVLHKQY